MNIRKKKFNIKSNVINLKTKRRKIFLDKRNIIINIYKNFTRNRKYINFRYLYILIIIFYVCLTNEKKNILYHLNKISEINLTIKGNGTQTILDNKKRSSGHFASLPSEIIVNDKNISNLAYKINLIDEINNITLRWNYSFTFCGQMFMYTNITKIDLSNFDSSKCENMISMFAHCTLLTSINLNNFNTSLVKNMRALFFNCPLLMSLDVSNFDTSRVTDMYGMFYNCKLSQILDLGNFNTSLVENMHGIFQSCNSLTILNLDNFDTSSLIEMNYMFCQCQSIKYLNINHFDTSNVKNMSCAFYDCSSLISLDISNFNTLSLIDMRGMFYKCGSLKSLDLSNFNTSLVINMKGLFAQCESLISLDISNFDTSLVTDISIMFQNCESLNYLELNNFDFSSISLTTDIFKNCNQHLTYCNYNENNSFILSNYSFKNNCSYICELKSKKYIYELQKCTYNCSEDDIYRFEYNNKCYKSCPKGTNTFNKIDYLCFSFFDYIDDFYNLSKNNNINKYEIIQNIRNDIINYFLETLIEMYIENKNEDLFYYNNDIIFQLTSTFNQKNNKYYNISSIDLGECEQLLRFNYNITDNSTILILKIDIFEEGLLIPIIEYDIINSKSKEILNLIICKDKKIKIFIPTSLDENHLFKYNASSEYYNDICFPYTTEDKTDIILEDRRNEYIENNMSLCEDNCDYTNYDFNNKKVQCDCPVKNIFSFISDISHNKNNLFIEFINIKNIININVIKCYKTLFTKEGLINNIGSYTILSIILIEVILIIIFKKTGYNIFQNRIKEIINLEKNNININEKKNKKIMKIKKKKRKKVNNNIPIKEMKTDKISKSAIKLLNAPTNQINNSMKDIIIFNKKNSTEKNPINNLNIHNYNDYELNHLIYEEALEKDKRTYFQYYFSLLKVNQLIIFTFYTHTDYNSRIIKISLFLFSFSLFYTVNGLFFDDSTLHKIYIDKGTFDLLFQISKIFYSSIISSFIMIIIKLLSLSEKNIVKIKKEKNNIKEKGEKLLKCLNIKFIIFYIFVFLFLIFFWLYISSFGAVYRNTQFHLLKDTLISFAISLLYPFGINLIPGIFRIPSLRSPAKNKGYLYKISKIIQLIL